MKRFAEATVIIAVAVVIGQKCLDIFWWLR